MGILHQKVRLQRYLEKKDYYLNTFVCSYTWVTYTSTCYTPHVEHEFTTNFAQSITHLKACTDWPAIKLSLYNLHLLHAPVVSFVRSGSQAFEHRGAIGLHAQDSRLRSRENSRFVHDDAVRRHTILPRTGSHPRNGLQEQRYSI